MVDATTFTSSVPVPFVDVTGCHIPAFADIYAGLIADYQAVYGSDVVLDPSTQDGEWLGIQAVAFNNFCAAFASAYNSYSPATAQGVGLSSVVKTNGITRDIAGFSTADLTIVGVVGTNIYSGLVSDGTYKWAMPTVVTIPLVGEIVVTAVCQTAGAISAAIGAVSSIQNQTKGWQSASNATPASVGAPVETDPQLRVRQSQSTALAATGVIDGIYGAILAVPNVTRLRIYENDGSGPNGNAPDANGIPAHTISAVVDGGDAFVIASVIATRKLSAGTYGTTSEVLTTGAAAIPRIISFFRPSEPPISWVVTVKPLTGFTSDVATLIQNALAAWTNALGIGAGSAGRIMVARAYTAALLTGAAASSFELVSLAVARDGNVPAAADVTIAFNEAPACVPSAVTVTPVT